MDAVKHNPLMDVLFSGQSIHHYLHNIMILNSLSAFNHWGKMASEKRNLNSWKSDSKSTVYVRVMVVWVAWKWQPHHISFLPGNCPAKKMQISKELVQPTQISSRRFNQHTTMSVHTALWRPLPHEEGVWLCLSSRGGPAFPMWVSGRDEDVEPSKA